MVFICRQCGSCCMYMGDYIAVDQKIGPFEYACESVSTGTPFTATVDEDKRGIFCDSTFTSRHPSACAFLRPSGDRKVCTIHRDSPPQCKFYRCVVMQILNKAGKVVGIVTGTLALHSEDPDLRRCWDTAEATILSTDPDAESMIQKYLEDYGYRII